MNSATSRRLTQMNGKIMPARGQTSVRHSKSKQPLSLSLSVLRPVSPSFEDLARVPTTDYSAGPGLGRGHHAAKGASHSVDFRRSSSMADSTPLHSLFSHQFLLSQNQLQTLCGHLLLERSAVVEACYFRNGTRVSTTCEEQPTMLTWGWCHARNLGRAA